MQGLLSGNLLSKASIFGSAGGSNIKSIQRGVATILYNATSSTVSIASVNTDKAIVKINIKGSADTPDKLVVAVTLTNENTLTFARNTANADVYIAWEVVEFVSVKSKQTGTTTCAQGSDVNVPITAVDLAKCMVFVSHKTSYTSNYAGCMTIMANLTTTTNLHLYSATGPAYVNWQIIEFN